MSKSALADTEKSINAPARSRGDLLVALGGCFAYGALTISALQSYSRVGPRFFPFLVAAELLLCGALLLAQSLRGVTAPPEGGEDVDLDVPPDTRAVGVIGASLAGYVLTLEPLDFVLASALLFWGVAFAFGSRAWFRDPVVGLALSLRCRWPCTWRLPAF